jgi:hypothetical protein
VPHGDPIERLNELVAEEDALHCAAQVRALSDAERGRKRQLEAILDACWDALLARHDRRCPDRLVDLTRAEAGASPRRAAL